MFLHKAEVEQCHYQGETIFATGHDLLIQTLLLITSSQPIQPHGSPAAERGREVRASVAVSVLRNQLGSSIGSTFRCGLEVYFFDSHKTWSNSFHSTSGGACIPRAKERSCHILRYLISVQSKFAHSRVNCGVINISSNRQASNKTR